MAAVSSTAATSSSTLTTGADVFLTANAALTTPMTINSLNLNGFSILGSSLLTVSTGLIMNVDTAVGVAGVGTLAAPVALGSAEGIFFTNTGAATTITGSSSISGSGGATVTGNGSLTIAASNTYTGTTTLDGSTLSLAAPTSISSGPLVLIGGTLTSTSSLLLANALA